MPRFKTSHFSGLNYAPKNVKMCFLASGASWIAGSVLVKAAGDQSSTQWYASATNKSVQIYPNAKALAASDVATSGVAASGANYGILGFATTDAPISFLQTASPTDITNWFQNSSAFENMYVFGYTNQEPIWVPISGTNPSVGDWLIPSSGTDGYAATLAASNNPDGYVILGKVLQVASGSEGEQVWTSSAVPKALCDPAYKNGW